MIDSVVRAKILNDYRASSDELEEIILHYIGMIVSALFLSRFISSDVDFVIISLIYEIL